MRATPKPLYAEESRLLFGNSHMFALLRAIHSLEVDTFTTRDLVHEASVKSNPLYALLDRLVQLGIIEAIGHVPGERTVLYRRVQSPLLDAIEGIEQTLESARTRPSTTDEVLNVPGLSVAFNTKPSSPLVPPRQAKHPERTD